MNRDIKLNLRIFPFFVENSDANIGVPPVVATLHSVLDLEAAKTFVV